MNYEKINKQKLNSKGITLIALIITIIVMLILVGVTVTTALNGGLIGKAKEAVSKTKEAEKEEQRAMAMANAAMNRQDWVYTLGDDKIPIPAGFAPTEIEGENSIEDGLVIIDSEGNEFVWIPCTLQEYTDATFQDGTIDTEDWKDYWYDGGTWNEPNGVKEARDSLEKLKNRQEKGEISTNGVGFYVARYEAGIPETASFYPKTDELTYYLDTQKNATASIKNLAPVSKKGYPVWNFI